MPLTLPTLGLLLLATIGLETGAIAQSPTARPANDSLAKLASQLLGQSEVRVRLPPDEQILLLSRPRLVADTIQFAGFVRGSWTLDTATARHEILLDETLRVEVRRSAWQKGGFIGFLAGEAALAGLRAAGKLEPGRNESLFLGTAFGLSGAIAGMIAAAPFSEWKTVYQHP